MRKYLFFSFGLLLVTCAVVFDSLFGVFSERERVVEIPNLVGLAESEILLPDWVELTTEHRYDVSIPEGSIISQEPIGGSKRKIGKNKTVPLTLTVSLGEEKKEIPPLVGRDIRETLAELRRMGFAVREQAAEGGEANRVIGSDPPSGSKLSVGSTVTVYYTVGKGARVVTVPDLTGLTRENALLQIYLSGLSAGEISEESSREFGADMVGRVIRQSPSAGSFVAEGTKLRLVILRKSDDSEE
jgi:serine/threonine-protein kinase